MYCVTVMLYLFKQNYNEVPLDFMILTSKEYSALDNNKITSFNVMKHSSNLQFHHYCRKVSKIKLKKKKN